VVFFISTFPPLYARDKSLVIIVKMKNLKRTVNTSACIKSTIGRAPVEVKNAQDKKQAI